MKTNQGIVNKCDHVQLSLREDDDDCKENINSELSSKLLYDCCKVCLKHFNEIMETLPLPLIDCTRQLTKSNQKTPLVSISVVDTDNNLNICMCNAIEVDKSCDFVMTDMSDESENICPICKNLIKAQPVARYSLVSRQTILGDVTINRIDSQFLSTTYSSSGTELKKLMDPYTPESIESHSPQVEMEELNFINNDSEEIPDDIRDVIKHKNDNGELLIDETENHHHTMDPQTLTTRLEILRRESQLECISKSGDSGSCDSRTKSLMNSKKCLCFSCAIL